jgi:hypothetical protein
MLAVSDTEFPTVMPVDDRVVPITGVVLLTTTDLQGLAFGLLLASPLYTACQLKVPVELKMTENGPAEPVAKVIVLLVRIEPEQLLPVNTLKVTVPAGLKPPDTVALALTEFPTTIVVAETDSATVGAAFPTVRVSVRQALVATLLLASPL